MGSRARYVEYSPKPIAIPTPAAITDTPARANEYGSWVTGPNGSPIQSRKGWRKGVFRNPAPTDSAANTSIGLVMAEGDSCGWASPR